MTTKGVHCHISTINSAQKEYLESPRKFTDLRPNPVIIAFMNPHLVSKSIRHTFPLAIRGNINGVSIKVIQIKSSRMPLFLFKSSAMHNPRKNSIVNAIRKN
jgi:hypothetical protein